MQSTKTDLRIHYNLKREKLPLITRHQAGLAAAEILQQQTFFQAAQTIAVYYPLDHEFDCLPICKLIWQNNKKCYLPKMVAQYTKDKNLDFLLYEENDELMLNRHLILEPIANEGIAPENLDLVFVPLIAFDDKGYRLGSGGGYYDYTFARKNSSNKPLLIGLGFSFQESINTLPHDAWDVPLDGILTENYFRSFASAKQAAFAE